MRGVGFIATDWCRTARLLLAALGGLMVLSSCGEKETRTVETGYVGRARLDPFYAATEFLVTQGRNAKSQQELPTNLDRDTSLLFAPASALSGKASFDRVARWVRAGGALVICIKGCERYDDWGYNYRDFKDDSEEYAAISDRLREVGLVLHTDGDRAASEYTFSFDDEESSSDEQPKIGDLIVRDSLLSTDTVVWKGYGGEKVSFELEVPGGIKVSKMPQRLAERLPEAGSFAATSYGLGTISVLTHAQPLRNRYLADNDHAAFLLQLTGQTDEWGEVLFVYGSPGSFWALLWERYWRVLVALILIIAIWLWKSGSRFGPVQLIDEQGHRMTRFQLMLSGGFFGKEGQTAVLIRSAQDRARRLAKKGRPHLQPLEGKELSEAIAKMLSMGENRVVAALATSAESEANLFSAHMQTLQAISQKLEGSNATTPPRSNSRPS